MGGNCSNRHGYRNGRGCCQVNLGLLAKGKAGGEPSQAGFEEKPQEAKLKEGDDRAFPGKDKLERLSARHNAWQQEPASRYGRHRNKQVWTTKIHFNPKVRLGLEITGEVSIFQKQLQQLPWPGGGHQHPIQISLSSEVCKEATEKYLKKFNSGPDREPALQADPHAALQQGWPTSPPWRKTWPTFAARWVSCGHNPGFALKIYISGGRRW